MQTALAWRKKKIERALMELADDSIHMVDFGVTLRVVRACGPGDKPDLESGGIDLKVVREHHFGGMVDTRDRVPRFVGPSRNPVVWLCSEAQEPLILHDDDAALRMLAFGAMGSGKTEALAKWIGLRVLEMIGTGGDGGRKPVEIGATAPTNERTMAIRNAIINDFPKPWYKWREKDKVFVLRCKVRIKLMSTFKASQKQGSRIQGQSWPASASDEIQDSLDSDPDIEARGRSARNGRYKRFCSATAKNTPEWREWLDLVKASPVWGIKHVSGPMNPFVSPKYWEDLKSTMSKRDYDRRVLALDVGPERMTYFAFDRAHSMAQIPGGMIDCTRDILGHYRTTAAVLVGYDPGSLFDVSIVLKAYRKNNSKDYQWWVVDEITTEQNTTEYHVGELIKRLNAEHGCYRRDVRGHVMADSPDALVRADPYGDSGAKPDKGVYTVFRQAGVDIRPAAYKAGSTTPGRISRDSRIELINSLFLNAAGVRKLMIACDSQRAPCAPQLVKALEMSERDSDGKAETQRKDKQDMSHWPSALGYALYAIEKPRLLAQHVNKQ